VYFEVSPKGELWSLEILDGKKDILQSNQKNLCKELSYPYHQMVIFSQNNIEV